MGLIRDCYGLAVPKAELRTTVRLFGIPFMGGSLCWQQAWSFGFQRANRWNCVNYLDLGPLHFHWNLKKWLKSR